HTSNLHSFPTRRSSDLIWFSLKGGSPMPDNKNFDIVIVGSGFGGTLAATLLMQLGKRVLILERGTWWVTPEKLGKPPAPDPQKPDRKSTRLNSSHVSIS